MARSLWMVFVNSGNNYMAAPVSEWRYNLVWQASIIQSLPGGNMFLQLLKEVFLHVSTVGVSRGSVTILQ